ncbi:MAG: phage tail family protein [Firmicutes bacterium]|nr:phage tail family protein [Bacillota bacterium]
MFNKAPFNRAAFNRHSTVGASMYATIISEYGMLVSPIKAQAKLPEMTVSARYRVEVGPLGFLVPLPLVTIPSEYAVLGQLSAYIHIPGVTIDAEYGVTVGAIRTAETDQMTLEGLNLEPGQTLIIDTDTLDIEVDGVVRVDCWVTGGSFFQLKAGDNTLKFTDNAGERELLATVLWADRYL